MPIQRTTQMIRNSIRGISDEAVYETLLEECYAEILRDADIQIPDTPDKRRKLLTRLACYGIFMGYTRRLKRITNGRKPTCWDRILALVTIGFYGAFPRGDYLRIYPPGSIWYSCPYG